MEWLWMLGFAAAGSPGVPTSQEEGRWPPPVEEALVAAKDNRSQIEAVLSHYAESGDEQKLAAACFLVGNMEGHGYTVYGLFDSEGDEIPFDALDYRGFGEAQAAMDALEEREGELEFRRREFIADLEVMRADLLIQNIDLAFHAWRDYPWARDLTFDAFCEHVLPYRGSNEPLDGWRRDLIDRIDSRLAAAEAEAGAEDLRRLALGACPQIGFSELYYLHPTDQGFTEMLEHGCGRCEDQTNLITYAYRAAGVAAAADYTPYWANRDNNHAWSVLLDAEGKGSAGLGHRAAKIYRKTYSAQRQNLAFQLREGEQAPPWLDRKTYLDVTSQYLETSDITVELAEVAPEGTRFAFLCVFNGGEWKAIDWGRVEEFRVTFRDMGRSVVYLPAYYLEEQLVPAGAPFFVSGDGECSEFSAGDGPSVALNPPANRTRDGETYELFVWRRGWVSLGTQFAGPEGLSFPDVAPGGLYWMVQVGSRRLERVFALRADGEWLWM